MKRKIAYILTTAVISLAAFSVGKFTSERSESDTPDSEQMETAETTTEASQEIKSIETTEYGMLITFGDNTGVFVDTESLEKSGLIDTANIVDWNTDGEELAVITKNDYEYYAYKSENIYQNRVFVPVKSVE